MGDTDRLAALEADEQFIAAIEDHLIEQNRIDRDAFMDMITASLLAFEARLGGHIDGMWRPADDVPPEALEVLVDSLRDVGKDN